MVAKTLTIDHTGLAKAKAKLANATGSLSEITLTNVLQYLDVKQRVALLNECYRVLNKGGKLSITVPHWCASVAYGDLAVQWPPVVEAWIFHLSKKWRDANKPVDAKMYRCDFEGSWGYGMHPGIVSRNQEFQMNALQYYKEAAQSLIATLTKQ